MEKPQRPPHVKLVISDPASEEPDSQQAAGAQMSLFPMAPSSLLGIVDMADISGEDFVSLLRNTRPRWLLDLRPLPRFDFDRLNRKRAFDLFEQHQIAYRDIAGRLKIYSRRDASLSAGVVASEMTTILSEGGGRTAQGPVLVLVDDEENVRTSANILPANLRPRPKGGWDMRIYSWRKPRTAEGPFLREIKGG